MKELLKAVCLMLNGWAYEQAQETNYHEESEATELKYKIEEFISEYL